MLVQAKSSNLHIIQTVVALPDSSYFLALIILLTPFTSLSRNSVTLQEFSKMEKNNANRAARAGGKFQSHVSERGLVSLSSPNFDLRYLYIAQMPVLYNKVVPNETKSKYNLPLTICHLCNIYIGVGMPYIKLPCLHQFHLRYVY